MKGILEIDAGIFYKEKSTIEDMCNLILEKNKDKEQIETMVEQIKSSLYDIDYFGQEWAKALKKGKEVIRQ